MKRSRDESRVKCENGDCGGGGAGAGGYGGSLRAGAANAPPQSDLQLIGRILDHTTFERASGGRMLCVDIDTWMTDAYRCNLWWLQLRNVDDVESVERRKLMIKGVPLGAPHGNVSPIAIENGSQGRIRFSRMKIALFESGDDKGWEMISGTPPAWFANVWKESELSKSGGPKGELLAAEFKLAKIFTTKAEVCGIQRDWAVM